MDKAIGKRTEVLIALMVILIAAMGVGGFATSVNQDLLRTIELRNKTITPPAVDVFSEKPTVRIVNSDAVPHTIRGLNPETNDISVVANLGEGESTTVTFESDGIWILWSPEYSDGTNSKPGNRGMVSYVGAQVSAAPFYGYYRDSFYRDNRYFGGQ